MPEDFEIQLREALRRQEPSEGFAERVIARAGAPKRTAWKPWMAAAAAAVLVAAPVAYEHHQTRVREDAALKARDEAILALQITAEKLNILRDKMQQLNGASGEETGGKQ
jgi:hypothetical protein